MEEKSRETLKAKPEKESKLIRQESMKILREYEQIEDEITE